MPEFESLVEEEEEEELEEHAKEALITPNKSKPLN
jgi:hypothetical protein